jgi:hypothetical protein
MASVEQASRAQSRAASPDASNPAIARAQAAAEHARQQSEAASLRVSNIERASANDRSRLEALESLPARMSEMQHAFLELSATMGTISKALGGRGTATNPIDVSSSSASYHQQPSSFQQVPVSFVSSASTNDPSTIMLQRLVETGSEVVGTLSPPLGVLDPFLPNATIDAIQSLPNQYRWFRKGASAEKLRTALGDIATWISGPEESAASASPANPRARAERWLRDLTRHNLTNILLANVPLTITAPRPESGDYDKIIITDASAAGWGGLCFVPSTGTMVMHAAQWPKPLNHSAIAEPRGLRLACRRFISASTTDRILLISDHSPIAAVGARDNPYAKGFELNLLFLELLGYPAASFSYAHVAGHLNPTDALSRDFVTEHGQCWDGNLESLRLKFFNAA